MSKLPTYSALLEESEDGITTISWVTNPATQIDMICFSEEDRQKFVYAEDEKQMVTSVVMLADTKIYRNNFGYEYYITYDKDTLIKMCEKMLKDNTFNTVSFEHDGNILDPGKISLVELYTVDETKKSPFNIPFGSIVATYKVNDPEIWQLFKSGEIGGISLEGYFTVKEIEKYSSKKTMLDKIKTALKSILVEAGSVKAEDGTEIYYDGDTLEIGLEVVDENGSLIADGEYTVEDKVIVVEGGKISEIKDQKDETEETPNGEEEKPEGEGEKPEAENLEDETEETPNGEENGDGSSESTDDSKETDETTSISDDGIATLKAEIEAMKSTVDSLIAEVEAIKTKIVEIETKPAVPAIEEEYEQAPKTENKWTKIGSMLR